jgi:hypothetical protein
MDARGDHLAAVLPELLALLQSHMLPVATAEKGPVLNAHEACSTRRSVGTREVEEEEEESRGI